AEDPAEESFTADSGKIHASTALDGVARRPGLDAVGNGSLHAVEEEEAAEKDNGDSGSGGGEERSGGLAVASERSAETVDDAGHGVQAVEAAPALGDQAGWVGDGRGKHPELDEEGSDVLHIAIKGVESGEPEANAESGGDSEQNEDGKPESGECGKNAIR